MPLDLKEVTTISASSIQNFILCPRKWFLRYVVGDKKPPSDAMKHGTKVHTDIEEYYTRKKDDFDYPESVECKANGLMPSRDAVDPDSVEMNASDIGLTLGG